MVTHITFFREHLSRGIIGVKSLQLRHGIIRGGKAQALLCPDVCQVAQGFQTLVVGRESPRPEQAKKRQSGQRARVERTLAPVNAATLVLVQACKIGLRKNDPAEQMVDKA